jgi:hypothetical protein
MRFNNRSFIDKTMIFWGVVLMNNKDIALKLESLLSELKEEKEDSLSTNVNGKKVKSPTFSGSLFKFFLQFWGFKILLISVLLIVIIASGYWLFSGSTLKKESITFVEQVQELATLATAEAHVKVIIEQEDNKLFGKDINYNLPGTKRELLLVVPATVIAGVDLSGITSKNIKVDDKEKRLEIVLPSPTLIQEPAIQTDKVKTFSDEGLFRSEVEWDEGFDLASEAQAQIKQEVIEIGLLQTAEKNAEKVLQEFFANLGYTVTVSFK